MTKADAWEKLVLGDDVISVPAWRVKEILESLRQCESLIDQLRLDVRTRDSMLDDCGNKILDLKDRLGMGTREPPRSEGGETIHPVFRKILNSVRPGGEK